MFGAVPGSPNGSREVTEIATTNRSGSVDAGCSDSIVLKCMFERTAYSLEVKNTKSVTGCPDSNGAIVIFPVDFVGMRDGIVL